MDLEWMLRDGSEPRFQIIERIGHGAFGEVFKARDLLSDEIVAIKRIFRRQPKRSVDKSASNEVSILKTLRHRNIVELIDVHRQSDYLTLEFEFCPTDLGTLLKRNPGRRFSNTLATCIIREVLIGLQFCHNAGVMHRDLKPSNILISRTGEIKIADFGQGRFVVTTEDKDNCYTPTVTSRWYRAPELLFSSRDYDSSIDIWAVGMIFAELLGGKPIICGESDLEQISLMIKSFGSIDVESWPEAMELPDYGKIVFDSCKATPFKKIFPFVSSEGIEFLEGALKYNPKHRFSASSCLRLPLFDGILNDWTLLHQFEPDNVV